MIETERLILRPHVKDDFPAYHAMNVDPRVITYVAAGKPLSEEESWIKFLRNAGCWQLLGFGFFAIIDKASGTYAGVAGIADFHRGLGADFDPFPEAGWTVAGDFHGRGYATEAVLAAHEWFAARHGSQKTVCIIDADNDASVRVADKLGYRAYGEAIYKEKRVIKFER